MGNITETTHFEKLQEELEDTMQEDEKLVFEEQFREALSPSDRYRIAQAKLGTDVVLREQLRVIGAKSWTEMKRSERLKLLGNLRTLWRKQNGLGSETTVEAD